MILLYGCPPALRWILHRWSTLQWSPAKFMLSFLLLFFNGGRDSCIPFKVSFWHLWSKSCLSDEIPPWFTWLAMWATNMGCVEKPSVCFPQGHELGSHCCRCHCDVEVLRDENNNPCAVTSAFVREQCGVEMARTHGQGGHTCWRLELCHTGPQLCNPCWVGFVSKAFKEQLFQY